MDKKEFYIFDFGQYKSKTIEEVYSIDPMYLVWLIENFKPKYFGKNCDKIKILLESYKEKYLNEHHIHDTSQHIGKIGDILDIKAEVYLVNSSKPNWEGDKMYKLIDSFKNKYIIKNLDKKFPNLRKGDHVNFYAKVLNHKEELGIKITELKIKLSKIR